MKLEFFSIQSYHGKTNVILYLHRLALLHVGTFENVMRFAMLNILQKRIMQFNAFILSVDGCNFHVELKTGNFFFFFSIMLYNRPVYNTHRYINLILRNKFNNNLILLLKDIFTVHEFFCHKIYNIIF